MIEEAAAAKNTDVKNEVLTAYNEVLRKLKVTKKVTQLEERQEEEKKQIVEAAVKETPEVVFRNFSDIKFSINEAISQLEAKMQVESEKLAKLHQVIEIKTRDLAEVNDIKVNVDTLTALMMAQKEKSDEFERELKERKQALEYELLQKRREWDATRRDLEQEMESKRTVMEEEFKEREARILAREAEYQQLKDREAAIVAREQEYRELKEKVERFPQELQRALQKTEQTVTEHVTLKYEYEAKLAQKEMDAERKVYQQTIAMLEAKIGRISHELQNITNI